MVPESNDSNSRAVSVGARLFAERGYGETTTRELALAIGYTKATFYHHFESKEDLLRVICEGALNEILHDVGGATQSVDDPLQRVQALIRAHVKVITRSTSAHTTMLVELRSLQGTNRAEVLELRDEYERLVEGVLIAAQVSGVLRSDVSGSVLRLLLLNLMNWTIFWFRSDGVLSPEALADSIASVFIDGAKSS